MIAVPLATVVILYLAAFGIIILLIIAATSPFRRRVQRPAPPLTRCALCATDYTATEPISRCPRCGHRNEAGRRSSL